MDSARLAGATAEYRGAPLSHPLDQLPHIANDVPAFGIWSTPVAGVDITGFWLL
jgi:hypothetical protein